MLSNRLKVGSSQLIEPLELRGEPERDRLVMMALSWSRIPFK
jgi:hypothetical protein